MSLYSPDPSFIKDLKRVFPDMKLYPYFSQKKDRWEIREECTDRHRFIITVCHDDGSFMPLDQRTVIKLQKIFFRTPDQTGTSEEIEKDNAKFEEDRSKDFDNYIDNLAKDRWSSIKGNISMNVGSPELSTTGG